jgi:phosphohistidine phosphatase SixA
MSKIVTPKITGCAWVALAIFTAPMAASAQDLPVADLVAALKSGGHVLYVRHAMTETDYADQVAAKLGDCATQRVLSEDGWVQAKKIGKAIEAQGIEISDVVSSEYCRAWQTADLAFGHYRMDESLNFAPTEDYADSDISDMKRNVTPFLSERVVEGTRIVVGHDDPFEAATGIYPEPQGAAYVVRPDGNGGFTVLGRIKSNEWPAG